MISMTNLERMPVKLKKKKKYKRMKQKNRKTNKIPKVESILLISSFNYCGRQPWRKKMEEF